MKKLLCLFLIFSLLFSFFSCKKPDDNTPSDGGEQNVPETPEDDGGEEEAPISESYINGVHLNSFTIVYSDEDYEYSKRAAEYIKSQILARTNIDIQIIEDSDQTSGEYEIVVGNTEREISARLDEETEGLEFSILTEEKQIAIEGDYFIIAAAAYYFVESCVPAADYSATLPLGSSVHQPIVKEAKNYIILIGDGMGVYHTRMFDYMENNVEFGDGEDVFYGYYLPYFGYSRTASLDGITDSAAGGTALACGIKTNNENIGRDKDLNDVKSLSELAFEKGMAAGVMSTEVQTGATPATFSSHADSRDSSNEIFESQMHSQETYGTIIDCGFDYYTERYMEKVIEKHITDTLGKLSENENGFFLMYEEAHIDKHSHNNDLDKAMSVMVRFNQAIARFMEFAFYNPDTFILITADHETGDLYPDENGNLQYHDDYHTLANVPIFAYGDGAELFDGVEIENIQIAHTIASFMGEDNFGDQSQFGSLTE